jgi:hypothetical protein
MSPPQVVDFDRLKRISMTQTLNKKSYNTITQVCVVMIFIGFTFLIKRFKDKKAHLQSDIPGTLQR